MHIRIDKDKEFNMDDLIKRLVEIQYIRSDNDFYRGTFRVKGEILDIFPSAADNATTSPDALIAPLGPNVSLPLAAISFRCAQ